MSGIVLDNVTKTFPGGNTVVKDVSLQVGKGELLVLTGPSNCGKSTLLRLIAGLDDVTSGNIYMDGQPVNYTDPVERNISIVFQNLTLYPHLSIIGNIEFGLKFSSQRNKHVKENIKNIAEKLEIQHILAKFPIELDVFEKQKVAFAKAAVKSPKMYLVDRMFADCEEETKHQLYEDIKNIWSKLNQTTIVAIDSEIVPVDSAMKIAVMNKGLIEQVGSFDELYNHPKNKFVAGFMGKGKTSFINAKVVEEQGVLTLKVGKNNLKVRENKKDALLNGYIGKEIIIALRPEDICTGNESNALSNIQAKVETIETTKGETYMHLVTDGIHFFVRASGRLVCARGEEITCMVNYEKVLFFDKDTEKLI